MAVLTTTLEVADLSRGSLQWIVVEQDRIKRLAQESIAMSCKYMKEKLGIQGAAPGDGSGSASLC